MTMRAILPLCLLLATPAWAAPELVVPPPLFGDGATEATLLLVVDDPTTKVKVKPSQGKITSMEGVPGGYLLTYLAPEVDASTEVTLSIKGSGKAIGKFDESATVTVVPPWSGDVGITPASESVKAGESIQIEVVPNTASPQRQEARDFRIAVSTGEVTPLVALGDGTWVARYTAPADLADPTQTIVSVVDGAAPGAGESHILLPVTVAKGVPFYPEPGSSNVLEVGGDTLGPLVAGDSGKVEFSLDLHPLVTQATLKSSQSGETMTTSVDLPIPTATELVLVPLPQTAPIGSQLPLTFVCARSDASGCAIGDVQLSTQGGTVGEVAELSEGVGQAIWTLPREGEASVTATIGGATQQATVETVEGFVTVTIASDPEQLQPKDKTFSLTARIKDDRGTAVVGKKPSFRVEGAKQSRSGVKDNKDGTYTASYTLGSDGEVAVAMASPTMATTGLPPHRVVLWPTRQWVAADGSSQVTLLAVVEDATGLPVPDVELAVSAPMGDGGLPPTAKTDERGVAWIRYTAGAKEGVVVVSVEGAGLIATAPLWQAGSKPMPQLEPTGSKPDLLALARWQQALPLIEVSRLTEEQAEAAAAAAVGLEKSATATTTQTPAPPQTVTATASQPAAAPAPAPAPTASAAPATTAAPASTAPAAAPQTGAPVTAKPAKGGGGGLGDGGNALRVRLAYLTNPFTSVTASLESSDAYPPDGTTFSLPFFTGSAGIHLDGEFWFGSEKTFGADLSFKTNTFSVAAGSTSAGGTQMELMAGFMWKPKVWGPVSSFTHVAFAMEPATFIAYNSDQTGVVVENHMLPGAMLGGGLRLEVDKLLVQTELSWSINAAVLCPFRFDVAADIPLPIDLPVPLYINVGGGYELGVMLGVMGQSDDVLLGGIQHGPEVRLGVGTSFL